MFPGLRALTVVAAVLTTALPAMAAGIDPDRSPDAVAVAEPYHFTMTDLIRAQERHKADVLAGRAAPASPLVEARERELGRRRNRPADRGPLARAGGPWHGWTLQKRLVPDDGRYLPPPPYVGKRVRPNAPQSIGANFIGPISGGAFTRWIPPDTNGAVGPNHFVSAVNSSLVIFDRQGVQLSAVALNDMFPGQVGDTFDPRIIYDRHSNRWMVSALEFNNTQNNSAFLTVSDGSDPTGGWTRWELEVGVIGGLTDYETLGVDDNGVYIGVTVFGAAATYNAIIAATKQSATGGYGLVYYTFSNLTDYVGTPHPVLTAGSNGPAGVEWIVGSSRDAYANVLLRNIRWGGSGPVLSAVEMLTTPGYGEHPNAEAKGSSVDISTSDDRVQMAMRHGSSVWLTRNVGVNAAGGSGNTRCAIEWMELDVSATPPVVNQRGRVYDASASDPRSYYFGSIAANGQGHVAIGFSGSNAAEYVTAYTCGRLRSDPLNQLMGISTVRDGVASYTVLDKDGRNRWGDYSYTSIDPNDNQSLWTIQEFAQTTNEWGTWVAQLLAPAPTAVNPAASAVVGTTSNNLPITGTGFYDPGAGYAGRFRAAITGGSPNGVTLHSAGYIGPTSATLHFDVAANAEPGPRSIILTNPDGQSVTLAHGLTVRAAPVASKIYPANRTGNITDTITLKATLFRSSDNALIGNRAVAFRIGGTLVGSANTNSSGEAALNWTITSGATLRAIGAAFAGDDSYLPCSGSATLTSLVQPTKVYVVDRTNVKVKTYTVLKAYLYTTGNVILPGRALSMEVDGTSLGSQVTNPSGYISFGYTVPEGSGAGNRVITASWAGNGGYPASSGTGKLGVVQGDLYLWPYIRSAKKGAPTPLKAYVRSLPDYAVKPGKSLTFKVNGSVIDSASAGLDGWASLTWNMPTTEPVGPHTGTAAFAGDAWYAAVSSDMSFNVVP